MPRNSRQTIAPHPFTTKELAESNWKQLVVKLSNSTAVLRYLTSKLVFTEESFSYVEAVTLFKAFEEIMLKMQKDRAFQTKYGPELFMFRTVYQSLEQLVRMQPQQRSQKLGTMFRCYRGKLFSRRYYYAVEGQAQKLYETFIKQRYPKTFPPKTYIGKGYGDHGTAKNKAFDGSQSWQEVASDQEYQERNCSQELEPNFHRQFQVHPGQLIVDDRAALPGSN